jgi:hypothetical protein
MIEYKTIQKAKESITIEIPIELQGKEVEVIIKEITQKENNKADKSLFFSTFGAWQSDESADELIDLIYQDRYFDNRNIEL